jgi:hypothetical protein
LFDAMKVKFRIASPPTGTTNVTIDTIPIKQWLGVSSQLRTDPYSVGGSVLTRYEAALRAANNTYMNGRLDAVASTDTDIFTSRRLFGRDRLRKQ